MNVFSDLKLNSKTSVYLQIIQHVKRKILNKSIIAYTPLPSRRELASLLSINPNTVQKSYKLMEEEGILRTISNVKSVVYVPIVCGASLFDLSVGDAHVRPDKEMGYAACVDAENDTVLEGNHGAGTGASVGKLLGFEHAMKSGIGTCGIQVGDLQVAAIVAVNACGNVVDYETNELLAGVYDSHSGSVLKAQDVLFQQMDALRKLPEGNTTIGCFVTNAKLDKAQCTKIAGIAHNGYARAIHPVHTMSDGDSIFVLSSGEVEVMADAVGMLATEMMAKAIKRAVLHAESAYGLPAHSDVICK